MNQCAVRAELVNVFHVTLSNCVGIIVAMVTVTLGMPQGHT